MGDTYQRQLEQPQWQRQPQRRRWQHLQQRQLASRSWTSCSWGSSWPLPSRGRACLVLEERDVSDDAHRRSFVDLVDVKVIRRQSYTLSTESISEFDLRFENLELSVELGCRAKRRDLRIPGMMKFLYFWIRNIKKMEGVLKLERWRFLKFEMLIWLLLMRLGKERWRCARYPHVD